MFCRNCGAKIEGTPRFCPECGAAIAYSEEETVKTEPIAEEPVWEQEAPAAPDSDELVKTYWEEDPQPAREASGTVSTGMNSTPILVWGIIGLAFSCTFWFSFLGIIFSSVSLKKAKNFLRSGGSLTGKAKVGRILAKVGLILGIVLTVFFVIWLVVMIAAVGSLSASDFEYIIEEFA